MTDDQMFQKEWDDISYYPPGLWRYLLKNDHPSAAWGLLVDLLVRLWCQEHEPPQAGQELPLADGTPVIVALRTMTREFLMQILGDQDGRGLQAVLDRYAEHQAKHGVRPLVMTRGLGLDLLEHAVGAAEALDREKGTAD